MADEKKQEKQAKAERSPADEFDPPLGEFMEGDAAREAGYYGAKPESEYDNEEYALTSGPDSPPYPMGKG